MTSFINSQPDVLQNIRDWAGVAVTINSAYRTPTHNQDFTLADHTRSATIDWGYKVENGKMYKRLYNYASQSGWANRYCAGKNLLINDCQITVEAHYFPHRR